MSEKSHIPLLSGACTTSWCKQGLNHFVVWRFACTTSWYNPSMSPEKETLTTFNVFPLGPVAITEGTKWIQNKTSTPDMLDWEKEKLKNSHSDLYLYIYSMGFLRRLVQFDDDEKIEKAYWQGAFFMSNAFNAQYETLWKEPPIPSQEIMKTHFFNLIDIEENHGAVCKLSPDIFQGEKKFYEVMSDFMQGYGNPIFDNLVKIFAINSQHNSHTNMLDSNRPLEDRLTRSSLNQTHGPVVGLVYGAFDIHELFRIYEEGKKWDEKWDIPTR